MICSENPSDSNGRFLGENRSFPKTERANSNGESSHLNVRLTPNDFDASIPTELFLGMIRHLEDEILGN